MPKISKETKHIIIGAVSDGALDGILEVYFSMIGGDRSHPLYQQPVEFLPPIDDWLVLGIPAGAYALGKVLKNKTLETVAKGGLLYGGAMFVKAMIHLTYSYLHTREILSASAPATMVGSLPTAKNGYRQRATIQKRAPQPAQALFV